MRIVLDTNVLFDDPMMVRDPASRVFELLGPARATLVFSPVVKAELDRQRRDCIESLQAEIGSRIKKLGGLAGANPDDLLGDTSVAVDKAHDQWAGRWNAILSYPHVVVADWPRIDAEQIVNRELKRRRPFMDRETGTIGLRDTLIWLGVVELVREDPDDELVFVTADKGFLGDKGLHRHLVEDLQEATSCVTHLTSLPALVSALQKESEHSEWAAWREPGVAEVVLEEIQGLIAEDFVEHWDERDGGTAEPTFDVGLPFTGQDWVLESVDGPQNLTLEEAAYGVDELVCTFVVDLYLSGFMDKSEWYADDHPEVDLWDADWNDQLVSVETSRRVRFRATLKVDDAQELVAFHEFLGAYLLPEPSAITLG